MLTEDQKRFYAENGYLMVENAVTPGQLARLREITARLIDASRAVTESNEVYDLDQGHTPTAHASPGSRSRTNATRFSGTSCGARR